MQEEERACLQHVQAALRRMEGNAGVLWHVHSLVTVQDTHSKILKRLLNRDRCTEVHRACLLSGDDDSIKTEEEERFLFLGLREGLLLSSASFQGSALSFTG